MSQPMHNKSFIGHSSTSLNASQGSLSVQMQLAMIVI